MVLIRWLGALGLACFGAALSAACNQSLFDNHGGGDGPGPGGDGGTPDSLVIPERCADPCIADAAADFNGTANGAGNRWLYLDDHRRNHLWPAMTASAGQLVGADPGNRVASCKTTTPQPPACAALPGALLISSAGATSTADPAIGFVVPDKPQVIQITLRVFVAPGDNDQEIRLYRTSREDELYTATAAAGMPLKYTLVLDALAGDRFVLAVAPTAQGATNVGVELFASGVSAMFPQTCQLALEFDGTMGKTSINDLCKGARFDSFTYSSPTSTSTPTPISLMPGPFQELGSGIDMPRGATGDDGRYLQGTQVLNQMGDLTVQFWMMQRSQDTPNFVWAFSDRDLDSGGGLGMNIQLSPPVTPLLVATTPLVPGPPASIDAIATVDGQNIWQFIRVVHSADTLSVCVNGKRQASSSVSANQLRTAFPPYLGKDVTWPPLSADMDGVIDDVRVFTGALPCE